jgi:hypothetical protein
MSTAKKNNVPPEKLVLYEKLVATNPDIERKGASVPYTSLNGNMFSSSTPPAPWRSGFLRENERSF